MYVISLKWRESQANLSPVVLFYDVICECGETQGLQCTAD